MALYNAVRYNYSDRAECTLVIDIGARSTDLIFLEQSRVFIRSVPVAGNAITQQIMREFDLSFEDAEEMKRAHAFVAFGGAYEEPKSEVADKVSKIVRNVMTRMHTEIDRSIKFYRSQQNGQAPALVLLAGGSSVIPYTDNFLREKLKVEVDYLNPFINVPVSKNISADEIGRHAHELPQLVGLALRKALVCPIEINLLPPKVVQAKAFRRKEPYLVMALFGLVLMAMLWCAYFFKNNRIASAQLDQVQSPRERSWNAVEEPCGRPRGRSPPMEKVDQLLATWRKARWPGWSCWRKFRPPCPPDVFLPAWSAVRVPPVDTNDPPAPADAPPPGSVSLV